jgi:hypothetical protein
LTLFSVVICRIAFLATEFLVPVASKFSGGC